MLTMTISGRLTASVNETIKRLSDLSPLWKSLSHWLKTITAEHFEKQRGHSGKWKSLSAYTLLSRKRKAENLGRKFTGEVKILRDTGALLNSLQGGANSILKITTNSLTLGTTLPYAKYHQQPGNSGPTNSYSGRGIIPKRDFLYFSSQDKKELRQAILDYLKAR